jgi:AraC-like DNA-binding protein
MSVKLTEYNPEPPLSSFVEFYWKGDFNTSSEPVLSQLVVPNGYVELVIHLSDLHCDLLSARGWGQSPDYTIIGLYTRPYEVQFRSLVNVFGIRFKPEGIFNLFGVPASLFSERFEDMEAVLGCYFREYCSKLRETNDTGKQIILTRSYLLNQLQKNYPEQTYLNYAADMIRDLNSIERVDELPGKVYISRRQLEREFMYKIGVTPKQYMRIARLNAINRYLQANSNLSLGALSYEAGFSDQAHLTREFKSLVGVPPAKFRDEIEQYIINV